MRNFNFKPLGLGNTFENRKMYHVSPCNGYNPTQGNNNLELTECWSNGCALPSVEPVRPGVAFTADGKEVHYFPLQQETVEIELEAN